MKILRNALHFLLLLSFSVSAGLAYPQSRPADAHVSGNLTDATSAGVGGVRIVVQTEGDANAPRWSATSSTDGAYSLSLPPGRYRVHFSRDPFVPRDVTLDLAAGASHSLNLRLELQTLSSRVLVTAQAQPIREQQSAAPSSILTREEIDHRQSVSVPDLLQFSPGVSFGRTGRNGGTASLFLDGGNSSFTKVLIDGSPVNPPGGAVDLSILTTDGIDKVEVVRGAESAIYGTDAVSGVVQLFSHRGTTRVPAFSLFSEGGSSSSIRGGAQISGLVRRFDYTGGLSSFRTNGQGPNDDFQNRTVFGNAGYSFTDTNQLHLFVRDDSSEAGIPGQTIFTPPTLHQRINQHLFTANARWNFAAGSHWQHQLTGAEAFTRQHSFNPVQSFYATDPNAFCPSANPGAVATPEFCDYTYDSPLQYNRASVNAQSTYSTIKFGATAGYQYEVENVENGSPFYVFQPHVRRNNQAGYMDFRYAPLSRATLDFGLRAEANDFFGTRVTPRAGASLALRYGRGFWGDTRARAFYGQGIKEPRFDQLEGTDACDPGNPALKPEASKNWRAGLDQKLAGDRLRVSADYFYYRFYDIVSFGAGTPPANLACAFYYTYFNTDRAFARGTNISAEARVAKWLFATGNYTYDDTRVLKSPSASDPALVPGNRLIRRPVHSGSITLTGNYRRFSATIAGYFSGVRTDSDFLFLGFTRNSGYARFDLSSSVLLRRGFTLYARATNLFDKSYQDALGYPALGRDARIGLRYQFSGRN